MWGLQLSLSLCLSILSALSMILNMTICIYLQHNATMVMTRVKKSRRSLCLGLVAVIDVFGLLKGVLISVVAILVRLHWMIV